MNFSIRVNSETLLWADTISDITMKPAAEDEMEDDYAAEEENKLINEVGIPTVKWPLQYSNMLTGVQNMVTNYPIHSASGSQSG